MIIVTGGAGFIGSNLVRALNNRGETDILVVDNMTDGTKFSNLADCDIADYEDKDVFRKQISIKGLPTGTTAVLHHGACSATTEWDGRLMLDQNFCWSRDLLTLCQASNVPLIYASSASVYGAGPNFSEDVEYEQPLNVYGYSKMLFDRYVRRLGNPSCQVVGLRYFNVYGPGEDHKQSMASVIWHFNRELLEDGEIRVFKGCDGYDDGEQLRDFVYVDDAVAVILYFLDHPATSGIFNTGTGRAQTFNDAAQAVIDWHGRGKIRYVPMPASLKGRYQSYTRADATRLLKAGYDGHFRSVEDGVRSYLDTINVASGD
jgi:ADP-L-glycero-D-manno-heptose 6-epimerase